MLCMHNAKKLSFKFNMEWEGVLASATGQQKSKFKTILKFYE